MPRLNWDQYDEASNSRDPLPDGTYLAELTAVEEASTKNGDEMWRLDFTVMEPRECRGRHFFDNMVFSEAAMGRVKLICNRMGLETKGEVEMLPSMIKGRKALVTVTTEAYQAKDGTLRKRNSVPFAGYTRVDGAAVAGDVAAGPNGSAEDNLPF